MSKIFCKCLLFLTIFNHFLFSQKTNIGLILLHKKSIQKKFPRFFRKLSEQNWGQTTFEESIKKVASDLNHPNFNVSFYLNQPYLGVAAVDSISYYLKQNQSSKSFLIEMKIHFLFYDIKKQISLMDTSVDCYAEANKDTFLALATKAFSKGTTNIAYQIIKKLFKNSLTKNSKYLLVSKKHKKESFDKVDLHNNWLNKKMLAVIIGVWKYKDQVYSTLPCVPNDTKYIKQFLEHEFGFGVKIKYFKNATLKQIKSSLKWLERKLSEDEKYDRVFVYYSGHADQSKDGKFTYLVPSNIDLELLPGIDLVKFWKRIENLPAKQALLILDCCYSGALVYSERRGKFILRESKKSKNIKQAFKKLPINIKNKLKFPAKDRIIITSCGLNEKSIELEDYGHGIFTFYLKQILNKKRNKHVNVKETFTYISDRVRALAEKMGHKQTPKIIAQAGSPFYLKIPSVYKPLEILIKSPKELQKKDIYSTKLSHISLVGKVRFGKKVKEIYTLYKGKKYPVKTNQKKEFTEFETQIPIFYDNNTCELIVIDINGKKLSRNFSIDGKELFLEKMSIKSSKSTYRSGDKVKFTLWGIYNDGEGLTEIANIRWRSLGKISENGIYTVPYIPKDTITAFHPSGKQTSFSISIKIPSWESTYIKSSSKIFKPGQKIEFKLIAVHGNTHIPIKGKWKAKYGKINTHGEYIVASQKKDIIYVSDHSKKYQTQKEISIETRYHNLISIFVILLGLAILAILAKNIAHKLLHKIKCFWLHVYGFLLYIRFIVCPYSITCPNSLLKKINNFEKCQYCAKEKQEKFVLTDHQSYLCKKCFFDIQEFSFDKKGQKYSHIELEKQMYQMDIVANEGKEVFWTKKIKNKIKLDNNQIVSLQKNNLSFEHYILSIYQPAILLSWLKKDLETEEVLYLFYEILNALEKENYEVFSPFDIVVNLEGKVHIGKFSAYLQMVENKRTRLFEETYEKAWYLRYILHFLATSKFLIVKDINFPKIEDEIINKLSMQTSCIKNISILKNYVKVYHGSLQTRR